MKLPRDGLLADLILNINLDDSNKRDHIVIETYEGAIPHLKSRQYSGPLRNVNINAVYSADNLSDVDIATVKNYLNSPSNVQSSKHQYVLSDSHLDGLQRLVELGCLFYKKRKSAMFEVDRILFSNGKCIAEDQGNASKASAEKTTVRIVRKAEEANTEVAPRLFKAMAYVDIRARVHSLRLIFDYDGHYVDYTGRPKNETVGDVMRDYRLEDDAVGAIKSHGWMTADNGEFAYQGRSFESDLVSLMSCSIAVLTNDGKRIYSGDFSGVHVFYGIDWFDLSGEVDIGGIEVPIGELIELNRSGGGWAELSDRIVLLPKTLQSGVITGTKGGTVARIPKVHVALAIEVAYELGIDVISILDSLTDYHNVPFDIDRNISTILRPYQETGVRWLLSLRKNGFGGCLADDMGLGKTLQVIAYLTDKSMRNATTLIVVPRTLLMNWSREFQKFSPSTSVYVYHGADRQFGEAIKCSVVITTYGTMLNDIEKLREIDFSNMIADEAQQIKNPKSKAHRAAEQIRATTKIILTGTPLENNILEYWGLMKLVNPVTLESVNPLTKPADDKSTIATIKRVTSPFLLRRMKKDVLTDLPEKQRQALVCSMEPGQRKLYDSMLGSIRYEITRKSERFEIKSNTAVLNGLTYLQEICCHPMLLDPRLNPELCDESVKTDLLMETLEDLYASGHKVVVFSRFTRMLHIIRDKLAREHYIFFYLDGQISNRLGVVDEFEESAKGVFLVSLKAGGNGLNLVSADTVIIYDPWWNPASEQQAEDRVFRIGQKNNVMIYRLIVANTIEEKIQTLQSKKRELFDQMLAGHETPAELSVEDIKALLAN